MRPSRSRSIAASLVQLALGLTPSTAFTLPPKINAAAAGAGAPAGAGAAGPRNSAGRLGMSARPTPGMDVDESSEYQYDEAEFADYAPDYSGVDDGPLPGDPELDLLDIDDLYADYSDIGGYDLSPFERHAREVFLTYAESSADDEEGDETAAGDSGIKREDLYGMLQTLDVEASEEESRALFKYLDVDDSGIVTLEEVRAIRWRLFWDGEWEGSLPFEMERKRNSLTLLPYGRSTNALNRFAHESMHDFLYPNVKLKAVAT